MRRLGPVLAALFLGRAFAAAAADPPAPPPSPPSAVAKVSGAYTFRTYCASCHGVDGRGEGPLAVNLRFEPPDLTLIAKRSGGRFPADRVYRIIDGRNPLAGHGGPEMPVWGDAFRGGDTAYDEAQAKARIESIVDHLKTLQQR
jgi:mono/diheme cytochrome c family protein